MKTKLLAALLGLALALSSCLAKPSAQEAAVRNYFDRVLRGEFSLYDLGGVTGYSVRSYEVVSVAPGLAIVKVTFASRAGTDLTKTKRFRFDAKNRLLPVEPEDVREGVKLNLAKLLITASGEKWEKWRELPRGGKIRYGDLFPDRGDALKATHPVAGEDYMNTQLGIDSERLMIVTAQIALSGLGTVEIDLDDAVSGMLSR